ncbi:MAG: LamG domain-containing protein, partial [Verrucomicrobiota bacterium]
AAGGSGGAPTDPDLVLWYKFDESTGTLAADSSGAPGGPRNGTLAVLGTAGAVAYTTSAKIGTHALALTGNAAVGGGYVVLPSIYPLAPSAITLAAWVYEASDADWQRVFDIGTGMTVQMFLTTREKKDANHYVRFVITTTGPTAEEAIQSTQAISLNAWHHLAVTLQAGSPYAGTLYIDGVAAATNPAMTLHPSDLGATTQSFIGKSQYATDPYMTGYIDDFRVYQRALTAAEIAALYVAR